MMYLAGQIWMLLLIALLVGIIVGWSTSSRLD